MIYLMQWQRANLRFYWSGGCSEVGSRGQNFGVKSHIFTPGPMFGVQMFTVPRAGRDLDVCSRRRSQERGESEVVSVSVQAFALVP